MIPLNNNNTFSEEFCRANKTLPKAKVNALKKHIEWSCTMNVQMYTLQVTGSVW